jgi:hypothetical protein
VERGQANKRRGSSIGLTRDRLVAVDRPEESPASGGGAPVRTRTVVREGDGLNHVLHGELPCDLGKALSSCLGSGNRRRCELDGGRGNSGSGECVARLDQ